MGTIVGKGGQKGGGGGGGSLNPDDIVNVSMTVRAAMGLLRALTTGNPMAGPDVTPLIQSLIGVLNTGPGNKNGKSKGAA
jgi:hypothetical protein